MYSSIVLLYLKIHFKPCTWRVKSRELFPAEFEAIQVNSPSSSNTVFRILRFLFTNCNLYLRLFSESIGTPSRLFQKLILIVRSEEIKFSKITFHRVLNCFAIYISTQLNYLLAKL